MAEKRLAAKDQGSGREQRAQQLLGADTFAAYPTNDLYD